MSDHPEPTPVDAEQTAAGWGIAPQGRQNRPIVRLLLWLTPPRAMPHRYFQHARILLHRAVCVLVSSDFRAKRFGAELLLPHPYGIVVHSASVIGDRVTIMQNVTLGENQVAPGAPSIGDDVVIGASACILGPVHVGDRAVVAAGAIVIRDVPADTTVVGNPARELPRR